MALTALESDTVTRAFAIAKLITAQFKPVADSLNIIYDSEGGAKTTITQENLDLVPGFSGISKAQLDDGLFVITSTLKAAVDSAYSQLAQLAARA